VNFQVLLCCCSGPIFILAWSCLACTYDKYLVVLAVLFLCGMHMCMYIMQKFEWQRGMLCADTELSTSNSICCLRVSRRVACRAPCKRSASSGCCRCTSHFRAGSVVIMHSVLRAPCRRPLLLKTASLPLPVDP
jgi:hypothetical protein